MAKYNNHLSAYKDIPDEELIARYRDGEKEIMDYLMDKYKNLVLSKTNSLYLLGGESEDLIQEGMIGLFQAVINYDFGRDASFFTFADLCISRKIYNAIKASNEKKHSFLNNYISFFESGDENEQGAQQAILDQLPSSDDGNPEKLMLTNELKEELEKSFQTELTELERENMGLYLTGMKVSDIARLLGKSPKETENSIQRAKNKLKKILEKNRR